MLQKYSAVRSKMGIQQIKFYPLLMRRHYWSRMIMTWYQHIPAIYMYPAVLDQGLIIHVPRHVLLFLDLSIFLQKGFMQHEPGWTSLIIIASHEVLIFCNWNSVSATSNMFRCSWNIYGSKTFYCKWQISFITYANRKWLLKLFTWMHSMCYAGSSASGDINDIT